MGINCVTTQATQKSLVQNAQLKAEQNKTRKHRHVTIMGLSCLTAQATQKSLVQKTHTTKSGAKQNKKTPP